MVVDIIEHNRKWRGILVTVIHDEILQLLLYLGLMQTTYPTYRLKVFFGV